ncbi:hypothetical protein BAY59_00370 [Prauserella coralliicola]|nr:hypothetical protein BAY59_00370 [Prauserella coralliicola]
MRLRGERPADFGASVLPVVAALTESTADLSRVRLVCDWVQYRNNFREAVDVRAILPGDDLEVAVDVRRAAGEPVGELASALLSTPAERVFLEEWGPGRRSMIWEFNALYWSALESWEQATGRGYEQALPGGESDARNREAAAELIGELFAVWDRLSASGALPDELYVVELGVGNGGQAQVFLDEFRALDRHHGKGYYQRLQYLMCDYSVHVLELARRTVIEHGDRVSSFAMDATRPRISLGFLREKAFLIYISNVYDNLPTDEVAALGGYAYEVHTRAYLPGREATALAESVSATEDEMPGLVRKLLRLGPSLLPEACPGHFPDVDAAVRFWQRTWSALRLAERYVPLSGLDTYAITGTLSGEMLRPLLESGSDVRAHVNNGALASFEDSLSLLHPFGTLVCHDLFVTDVADYRTSFRGPGKYDGSVVNWVNGPLIAHVGQRRGFDVRYQSFRRRSGGNIVTMTAQARD